MTDYIASMIWVTGGAGFIGSNLVAELNNSGYSDILIVDQLGSGSKFLNLNPLKFTDYFEKDSFLQKLSSLPRPDYIFHQGACTDTLEKDSKKMLSLNYEFSLELLEYSAIHRVPFIYASSAAVYGNKCDDFKEESGQENPVNIYAFSKHILDLKVRRILRDAHNPIIGLRYFNVYGKGEAHKGNMASVFHQFFKRVEEGKSYRLFQGSEKIKRDFIHVQDVVKVNMHFMNHTRSGIFNVGTGEARSFADLANILDNSLENANREYIEFPEYIRDNYQFYTCADIEKLRNSGFDASFLSLEEGGALYLDQLKNS